MKHIRREGKKQVKILQTSQEHLTQQHIDSTGDSHSMKRDVCVVCVCVCVCCVCVCETDWEMYDWAYESEQLVLKGKKEKEREMEAPDYEHAHPHLSELHMSVSSLSKTHLLFHMSRVSK